MAYLRFSQAPPLPHLTLGFPSTPQIFSVSRVNFSPSASTLRFKDSRRLQVNQRLLNVFATNPNSADGKSLKEGSDVNETSNAAQGQGPPLLTILAGLFVFLLVSWIIVSIVMWLISLIVNVPSAK